VSDSAGLELKIFPKKARVIINGEQHRVVDGRVSYSGGPMSEAHVLVSAEEHQGEEKTFRLGDVGTIKEFRFRLTQSHGQNKASTKPTND
jgi:hypothetical protein